MALAEGTKACSKCGRRLPLAGFYALRWGLQWRRPDCKACHNDYHNRWARGRYVLKTGRRGGGAGGRPLKTDEISPGPHKQCAFSPPVVDEVTFALALATD